ncbi:hypothetical protein FRC10_008878 [Ceratobasidium sp. 414]|nr:hypothetical protein FRC10_008878 [Ceratobasidium sp. 414]
MSRSQRVKGPRWLQIPLVNLPIIGIQFVWSAEAAFVSLYLLELGLSRAHMTLVMIAGPLSGLIVQPIIGTLADRSTSRWGRRRPYMLAGSVLTALSLIMLSRAQELSAWISGRKDEPSVGLAQAIAILAVYLIDFTINVSMVAARTLAMDVLPTELQSASGAWASRMVGVGGVIGFYAGTAPLDKLFPALGNSQVAVLTALAAICLLGTQVITASSVSEAVHTPTSEDVHKPILSGVFSKGGALLENLRNLPRDVKSVCAIQFFAMGWFPAMFFGTVWMGDIYIHQMRRLKGAEAGTDEALRGEAARAGSRIMLYGAMVTLATSLILPRFVKNLRPEDAEASESQDETIQGATFLYVALGFHGGVGHWVPYAIVSVWYSARGNVELTWCKIAVAAHKESSQSYIRLDSQQPSGDTELEALLEEPEPATSSEQAQLTGDAPNRIGWFLGLQNVSLVLPMFICILMSATIFSILEPGRSVIGGGASGASGEKRGSSMDIVLSIGGLCSLVSCFLTRKLLK